MTPVQRKAESPEAAGLSDEAVIARVLAGDTALFELIMRRYNQRLYRAARAITRDDDEAEDATQQAYLSAYENLDQWGGRAAFATWLTRIAINSALRRRRRRASRAEVSLVDGEEHMEPLTSPPATRTPEEHAQDRELGQRLEDAIDRLPEGYRVVFMLREVQELDIDETSSCLEISPENVKVRLHRAKAMLREALRTEHEPVADRAFPFLGSRCDRIVAAVLARLPRSSE